MFFQFFALLRPLCLVWWALFLPLWIAAQSVTVSGKVWTQEQQALPGALVELGSQATTTDSEGRFEFVLHRNALQTDLRLKVSYLGYVSHTQNLNLTEDLDLGEIYLSPGQIDVGELVILSNRADLHTPMAVSNLSRQDIQRNNLGADLPYLLENTPSVVVTSDAGAGVGYTGIWIRGSDATRTNLTINGIPLNDAESHGTFLVNLPDFASSVQSVQIQRGVGTSTNGAGAFGATVAIETNRLTQQPYAELANSYGSFQSRKHTVQFGTGLFAKHFMMEGRLSHILSQGYIDRANSNLRSFFLTGAFVHDNTSLYVNIFSGKEITYQAWGGVPIQFADDRGRGASYFGKSDSLRRFNPYTYEQEVDNYQQTHYQLHFKQSLPAKLHLRLSLHYTEGKGFYEQYRNQDRLSDYGLEPVTPGDTVIERSDLIRRRWLDNDFYGMVYGLDYKDKAWQLTLGGGWNRYVGKHFGEVIWAQYASNGAIRHRYYDNDGIKLDGNTYLMLRARAARNLYVYADLQHRYVRYSFLGNDRTPNNDILPLQMDTAMHFFNPKVGLTYRFLRQHRVYASFGMANKEPNRNDFTSAVRGEFPRPETLYDTEIGYGFANSWLNTELNAYLMYYTNQLVLTGQINDVGSYIRNNVPNSYRLGLEWQASAQITAWFKALAHLTWSRNKIVGWTEYVDNWDTWEQETVEHKNTDLAFSPAWIAGTELSFLPLNRPAKDKRWGYSLEAAWTQRYVGKQYIDNTQSSDRSLPAYWRNDLRLTFCLNHSNQKSINLTFALKNFLNAQYSANAWTYRFQSPSYDPTPDDPYTSTDASAAGFYQMIGLYPQAGIHYWLGLSVRI